MPEIGCGEFGNVHLSFHEHAKLRSRFGPQVTDEYIERLSCYLKRHPRRKCYSAYATILTWIRTDGTIEHHTPKSEPLVDEMEIQHRALCLQRVREREGLTPNDIDSCLRAIRELDGEKS